MTKINIIRAWKDSAYFESLTDDEKAMVPANPAGSVDTAIDAATVVGGRALSASARAAASCTAETSTCCNCKVSTARAL